MKRIFILILAAFFLLSFSSVALADSGELLTDPQTRGNSLPTAVTSLPYSAHGRIYRYTYTSYMFKPSGSTMTGTFGAENYGHDSMVFSITLYTSTGFSAGKVTYPAGTYNGYVGSWSGLNNTKNYFGYITKNLTDTYGYFSVIFDD
ncbi:hypothetical protein SDC9_113393 [bioreactor metagenome]|uniref:Uncharacterized protein n=1 Tax=bioreactor metagenome TaxID=1076179 RepID=A0A645BM91_9ZZZZ